MAFILVPRSRGSRVHAIVPPVSLCGPVLNVRKFSSVPLGPDALVDEALALGHLGSEPLVVHAKMLRLELLNVKADLERELGQLVLDCSKCSQTVHWVAGLGVSPGQLAHRESAPHGEPVV